MLLIMLKKYIAKLPSPENTPMGNELKWLLKEGGGRIFKSFDISLENTLTSHTVSLALFMYACSNSAVLFCPVLAYTITAKGGSCLTAGLDWITE